MRTASFRLNHFFRSCLGLGQVLSGGLLVLCMFILSCGTQESSQFKQENLPVQEVRVSARQFAWEFTQAGPDGLWDTTDDIRSGNRLVTRAPARVKMVLESRDVIHGFWVPDLKIRQTLVPGGKIIKEWVVTQTGQHRIACAELCGLEHSKMVGVWDVIDETQATTAWVQKKLKSGSVP